MSKQYYDTAGQSNIMVDQLNRAKLTLKCLFDLKIFAEKEYGHVLFFKLLRS